MRPVYICDGARTPIGRYGGGLSSVRPDDLAAHVLKALSERHSSLDRDTIDEVVLGCANQAGEDNRNVARMALLLAGLPQEVPGTTVNRLCGSGMDAVSYGVRQIAVEEAEVILAGGVESMSRAPFVVPKAEVAFSRQPEIADTTIGWRFVNPKMAELYGTDALGVTAENVAQERGIGRTEQDDFAARSQELASSTHAKEHHAREIIPVPAPLRKQPDRVIHTDEHPRPGTTSDALASLRPTFIRNGTVTAGNSSGVNDGACALMIASADAVERFGLKPIARVLGTATAGVAPRVMGLGPIPATKKLLNRLALTVQDFDVIELNEAFAAQALAVAKDWGLSPDDARLNPLGGAIALGHPLGMSGARLVLTAARQLEHRGGGRALCTMCIGVGQGIAMAIEAAW